MNVRDFMQLDADGTMHFDVPKFLKASGYADTPGNRDAITQAMIEVAPTIWPGVEVNVEYEPTPPTRGPTS